MDLENTNGNKGTMRVLDRFGGIPRSWIAMKVLELSEMVVEQLLSSSSSTEARWESLVSKVQNNDSYFVGTDDEVLNPQGLQSTRQPGRPMKQSTREEPPTDAPTSALLDFRVLERCDKRTRSFGQADSTPQCPLTGWEQRF
jgi:hypothetical protein